MFAIAPAILCIAFLVDPHPGPDAETIAALLALVTVFVWAVEAAWRIGSAISDA